MSKKSIFRGSLNKQHGTRAQTLLKSHTASLSSSLITDNSIEFEKVSLLVSHAQSWDYLLLDWLRMESILFLIETIE